MKYNRLHINHFGRLQNRTLEFEDGIHIISGPNESGKSTLHAFLEVMLFGMERVRGRGAKNDSYHRFFPEEGSSTYGGVLEFTQDDVQYSIYRNFQRDASGFTLMDQTHKRQLTPTDEEYHRLIAGLTLPLYRNTVSLRQLQAATSAELPLQLRNHIVNLRSTGSGSLDLSGAKETLKKQRKEKEAARNKEAGEKARRLQEEIEEGRLALENTPLPEDYALLSGRAKGVARKREETEAKRERLMDAIHEREEALSSLPRRRQGAQITSAVCFAAAVVLLAVMAVLLVSKNIPGAILAGCFAAAACLAGAAGRRRARKLVVPAASRKQLIRGKQQAEVLTEKLLALSEEDRQLEMTLRQYRETVWQREKLEEEIRRKEDELDGLAETLARNKALEEDIDALDLARDTLDRLSSTEFASFGSYLQDTASTLIRQITGGRYSRLLIDDDMHILLEQDHQPVELTGLSCSTLDQVYLALRIACIDFFWPEDSIPLLLDESFAMYDADRIAETLSWLAENYPGQVFLFTCQNREAAVLRSAGIPFRLIEM